MSLRGERKKKQEQKEWIVNVKGAHDRSPEISVVRASNKHGIESYGWVGENKILIFGSGGPCKYTLKKWVFNKHIETAKQLCEMLNNGE